MTDIDELERLAKAATESFLNTPPFRDAATPGAILALIAEVRALREIQAANVEIKLALHLKTLDLAEEKIALKAELNAWRQRFQAYVYRPQDDCVANRFWLERRQPDEEPK